MLTFGARNTGSSSMRLRDCSAVMGVGRLMLLRCITYVCDVVDVHKEMNGSSDIMSSQVSK